MKKKFLALVLTLAMVLSLVPVTALAAGGNSPVTEVSTDANSPVQIKKSVNEEGNMLTLEAYLTNEVTQTVSAKPLDIVLVLDQSGSMAYNFSGNKTGKYSDTRQYAMKSAVVNFIDKVNEQYSEQGDHHMAIVTFGSEATTLQDWTAVDTHGVASLRNKVNSLPQNPQGATNVGAGMERAKTLMNSASAGSNTARQKVVIVFTDGVPTTQSDFNTNVANKAIAASKDMKDAGAVVYTVGIFNGANPNEMYGASGFTTNSDGTINSVWKQEEWGLFPNADFPTADRPAGNRFLNLVSSNYPAADSIGLKRETLGFGIAHSGVSYTITKNFDREASNYYLTAGNASGLNNIFQQIIEEISTLEIVAGTDAILSDTLSEYFDLNIPEGATEKKDAITVEQWNCTGKSGNDYAWEKADPQPMGLTVTVNGKTINVTGFNYTKNAVTATTKNGTTNYSGSKLVVTIPIKADTSCENWTSGEHFYPTNDTINSKAGLSGCTDEDGDPLDATQLDNSTTVGVTAYTVTYEWGNIENATPVTDNQYYINGQTAQVKGTVSAGTAVQGTDGQRYRFNGWSLDGVHVIEAVDITDSNVTLKPVLTEAYTVTYTDGVENEEVFADQVYSNLIKGDNTPSFSGTPTRDGYKFTGWKPTVAEKVTGNAVYTAQWEKEEVLYTLIFDPNGGAWSGTTVDGYTVSEGKASRSGVPGTEKITSTSITAPTKQGKVLDGWGYYDNGKLIKISNLDYPIAYAPTVKQLYDKYGQKPTNTVILYAIWKDDTTSADSLTYTIKQHYIRSETDADHVEIKDLSNEQVIKISDLIKDKAKDLEWRDGHGSLNHYAYVASETTVTVPNQPAQPYNENDTLSATGTVIDLYYYLDDWKDADNTPGEDTDSATGGDGIPDCQQVKIQYLAYEKNGGNVSRQVEIATFDNDTLNAIHGSTATANSGFTFVTWSGKNVEVNSFTVNNVIATTEPKSGRECKPSSTELVKGNAYTYTAIFLEDKIGDRNDDGTDKGDEIPDRYQVTINYVSSDTSKGSVGTLTKEVLTIYENGKEGKWASKGKVVASGSTATATGNRCYFVNWTKQQEGSTASSTVTSSANLPAQTIENAKGGDVYTFTANFDRSSGGGSGGSHKPTVTIPDDVPTGLNGKDHYAYVVGYPDGMVYPQKNITRAEVATIFFRLLTDETREANMTKSNGYNDMKDGAWYTCAVSTLSKMGIIKGYEDGSFKPDASISRAEFAAIAARFDPDGDKTPATFSDVSSHWAKDEISIAANHGWIKGYEDGSFKPDQKITRAETMTLVNRVLKRLPETKDDLHKDMKTWPDNQNESAWFYLAVQEATNSHYQKLKKDGIHETWESMRETRDWAALEK